MKFINVIGLLIILFVTKNSFAEHQTKTIRYKAKDINVEESWSFREEGTVQRFELRHGDAAKTKKQTPDSQRVEMSYLPDNFCGGKGGNDQTFSKCKDNWIALNLKIPEDFPSTDYQGIVSTSKLYILQMKTTTSLPLWDLNLNKAGTELVMQLNDSKNKCVPIEVKKGIWNEIVVYSSIAVNDKNNYFRFWLNGKEVGCPNSQFPIVVRKEAIQGTKSKGATVSWGLYRTSLTKYLLKHNKVIPQNMEKACPSKKWENKECAIKRPFDYEWQNKIPTIVLYFDKIYVDTEPPKGIALENFN